MATPPIFTYTILPWNWRGDKYSLVPCTRDSAHKTFEPTVTSMYSVCIWRVFGGIGHRTQAFRSGVRCSNHQATHGPELCLFGTKLSNATFFNSRWQHES
ncbi:hypothetical protein TNCV_67031 [Trichonephila clavipes]|nr:hypothetical protein TNCV_67031 [Trichonephila clavipes]